GGGRTLAFACATTLLDAGAAAWPSANAGDIAKSKGSVSPLATFLNSHQSQESAKSGRPKTMAKLAVRVVAPGPESRKVPRTRAKNHELRTREYLTEGEVEALIAACKGARWPHRDATMILLAFRHGLRALELVDLEWTQIDFGAGTILVKRRKNGS